MPDEDGDTLIMLENNQEKEKLDYLFFNTWENCGRPVSIRYQLSGVVSDF